MADSEDTLDVERMEMPEARTHGLVVHYASDGVQPVYREFESASDARQFFERRVEFRHRLSAKGLENAPSGDSSTADAMLLLIRWREDAWVVERSMGSGMATVRLRQWVELRTRAMLERPPALLLAYVVGCLVRGLLYVLVQRFEPKFEIRRGTPRSRWAAQLVSWILRWAWPTLRATINETVTTRVPGIVNGAIAKLAKKPIDKISRMVLDVGPYPPYVSWVSASPSLVNGMDAIDLDLGLRFAGDGVRFRVDVSAGGEEADACGEARRCALEGSFRIKLGPLITPLPCARVAAVGLASKPRLELEIDFKKARDDARLPVSLEAVGRFVHRLVENVLDNVLCWPRHVNIPLAKLLLGDFYVGSFKPGENDGSAFRPQPIGTLRVEVLRCSDLINNRISGLSNPYVICKLGQQEERTTALSDTVDPVWPNPRTFLFDVHEAAQLCCVSVYDSEANNFGAFNDALLGRATFMLAEVLAPERATSNAASVAPQRSSPIASRPPELRIALDTSVYDGSKSERTKPRQKPNSAVYLLAKFTPNKASAASEPESQPRGMAPIGVALAVVLALAVLVDLLARHIVVAAVNAGIAIGVTLTAVSAFVISLLFVLGAIV